MPSALGAWNLNPWTAEKVPGPVSDQHCCSQDSHGDSVMISCCVIWSSYLHVSSALNFCLVFSLKNILWHLLWWRLWATVPLGLADLRMFSFCPCIWKVFSSDGEFWVDRFLFLPQHFKDVVPLSSDLHWSLVFSDVMTVCPGIVFSLFILFWFCWTSWICYSCVFHLIWGFWPFFLQIFFSPSLILFWGLFAIALEVP